MKGKVLLLALLIFMVACSNQPAKNTDNDKQTANTSQIENNFDPSQMNDQQLKEYQQEAEKALAENKRALEDMMANMTEEERAAFEKELENTGMSLEDFENPEKMMENFQNQSNFDPKSMGLPSIQTGDLDRLAKNEKIASQYEAKISEIKDDITIEDNSGPAPSSMDELENTFKLEKIASTGIVGDVSDYKTPAGKVISIGTSGDGISTIIDPLDNVDIKLPYDIDMDDKIESARKKLIDGAEITAPSEFGSHLEFAAGKTSFELNFGDDGKLSHFSIGKIPDTNPFSQQILTQVYIDKDQKREEGSFEIDGNELTFPMTLGELKEKLGGEFEPISEENFTDFADSIDINNVRYLAYNVLKAGDKNCLVEFKHQDQNSNPPADWITNPDMGYMVNSIGFLPDIPFSVKNKDIEINEKNYKDLEQTLLDKQIPFMDSIDGISFPIYDNIKFAGKEKLVTFSQTFYERRLYDEAELKKSVDQAYKSGQGL
ncbi:hypothetical protein ACKRLN_07695 [Anaerococcus sp. DFU013_CI05]|uniref:hypothetical protein n=1 Tax=Anaerococcus sp. AH8042_DFU013_CI05 TaxID=3385202 RepID=UPI003A52315F